MPKRRRKIKELNKKEAVGDLLDAFKEVRKHKVGEVKLVISFCNQNWIVLWFQVNPAVPEVENQPPAGSNPGPETEGSSAPSRPEEADETWDAKEDKIHNVENIQPAGEQKYEYKSGMLERRVKKGWSFLVECQELRIYQYFILSSCRSVEASKP